MTIFNRWAIDPRTVYTPAVRVLLVFTQYGMLPSVFCKCLRNMACCRACSASVYAGWHAAVGVLLVLTQHGMLPCVFC